MVNGCHKWNVMLVLEQPLQVSSPDKTAATAVECGAARHAEPNHVLNDLHRIRMSAQVRPVQMTPVARLH